MNSQPRIITNMAFWQSPEWLRRTTSIYPLTGAKADPKFHSPWIEALMLMRRRRGYDVVLTMGARASFAYGLLCLLSGRRSKQILTEYFIDAHRRGHPFWHFKHAIYRAIARRAIGILTNSTGEIDTVAARLDIPRDRLRFVPLNTNIQDPRASETDDGFVLAAGRTLRDYQTLLRTAPHIDKPITIICGFNDLEEADMPDNVTLLYEVSREFYLDQVRRCTLVALPLLNTERSTGQVVMLEAMALGKPVVTTRSPGTVDYIRDGENGCLVPVGDADALAGTVNALLADPARARALADAALCDTREKFSITTHTRLKLDAIRELWSQSQTI
ncbi:MAG: glycosyltransferase family 4 protein [bacterium]